LAEIAPGRYNLIDGHHCIVKAWREGARTGAGQPLRQAGRHGIPPCTRFSQLLGGLTHHDRELISLTSPSSVCAAVPLPLLVSQPAPGGLDRTVITITAYLQHGRSALAGQVERHLGREKPSVGIMSPARANPSRSGRQNHNPSQFPWHVGAVQNLARVFGQET